MTALTIDDCTKIASATTRFVEDIGSGKHVPDVRNIDAYILSLLEIYDIPKKFEAEMLFLMCAKRTLIDKITEEVMHGSCAQGWKH